MKKFFALLVLGLLLSGITYGQPDLSERIQPLPVEYDVGCDYAPVSFCNFIYVPIVAKNVDPSEAGGDELSQFGNAAYGLAR